MQNVLLVAPDAGDLIRGGAGLRKLRWCQRKDAGNGAAHE